MLLNQDLWKSWYASASGSVAMLLQTLAIANSAIWENSWLALMKNTINSYI